MTDAPDPSVPDAAAVARHLVGLLSQPACLVDLDGRVLAVSSVLAERLDLEPGEIRGRHLVDFVDEGPDAVVQAIEQWAASGGWRPGGLHVRATDTGRPGLHCRGARLPGTELLLVELSEHERAVADFVALTREVELANLRRMEARLQDSLRELGAVNERLEAANAELDSYASMVAHDIRTPFNAIARFADLVLEDHPDDLPEGAREMVAAIGRLADRGEGVTRALLELARVGEPELVPDGTDSNAVAERVLEDVEASVAAVGGEVIIRQLPWTGVQPVHLERILLNLLTNALKYTAEDRPPRVVVEGTRAGDLARFAVRDNGVGIPEGERERIFEPLFRGAAAVDHPGTGVGLATCRKIVEAYGGAIHVEDEAGDGATIAFTLPAADPPAGHPTG